MKVLKTFTRLYVKNIDSALVFYEQLLNTKPSLRFTYPAVHLELAGIGDFLLLAGSEEALASFRETKATCIVDSILEFRTHLLNQGSEIIRDIREVPTGKNMTIKHPDGTIIEYVEFKQVVK